MLLRLFSPYNY